MGNKNSSNAEQNLSNVASRKGAQGDAVASLYPEHEKLKAKQHESHVLSGFLDMLDERRFVLASYHEHAAQCYDHEDDLDCGLGTERLYDYGVPTKEQLIGLYLDIDPKKLSAEKDAMYEALIAANRDR